MKNETNNNNQNPYLVPGAIVIAGFFVAVALFFGGGGSNQPAQLAGTGAAPGAAPHEQQVAPEDVSIDLEGWPSLGDPDAPVVMVEYSDFSCSFCTRFAQETLSSIKSEYINEGLVRFVYKDFVVVGGDKAAEAAHCAGEQGEDAQWAYHDLLFENNATDKSNWSSASVHRGYAQELGLDANALVNCFESGKYSDKVAESTREAGQNGGRGTPYFLINDTPVSGAQPFSAFQAAIDSLL